MFSIPRPTCTMQQVREIDIIRPVLDWKAIKPDQDVKAFDPENEEFVAQHLNSIIDDVTKLADYAFGHASDLGPGSAWLNEFPPEFCDYVSAVAHSDPYAGHWEDLLQQELERIHLASAVILKAIDEHALSKHLFGADERHKQVLERQDDLQLRYDGLNRTYKRAVTNRVFLGPVQGVPPHFWQQVDELAVKISAMLLPLYNLVREAQGEESIDGWSEFYERLHAIVARAAWLNVIANTEVVIIMIEWVPPGETWEQGQFNLSPEGYEKSKKWAARDDKRCKRPWSRMARVKLSAAPQVTLVTNCEDVGMGYACWRIRDAAVIYYQGFLDVNNHIKTSISLREYIEQVRPTHALGALGSVLGGSVLSVVGMMVMIRGFGWLSRYGGDWETSSSAEEWKSPLVLVSVGYLLMLVIVAGISFWVAG